ncbi:energy-coupling factor transporter transmembrane component T family protein [Mycoplasmopsis columbina]|uniref:Cobalt/nickel transport system permease protein n=1 Tax=Mycoplasmopsis columbina SF7 TaxID=1037410 RepID=F9UK03_9BACT|nr:energy-coupling factor transporter transmembrane component T [Mycoplasmopsis columbina]EGV00349.1 cobalt/nickel transport system permease protein [Mycoplasmopsis columbina SF7]VEU76787.1 Energy-coupling factor transporter transmembrane protein EcfT [Mycoplasmopsis columbina]
MGSPIGRYMAINSFIHKLDSRLKLALNIVIIVLIFFSNYFLTTLIILIPLMIAYVIATKRIFSLVKLLKMPIFVGIIIFAVNIYTMKIDNLNGFQYSDSSFFTLKESVLQTVQNLWNSNDNTTYIYVWHRFNDSSYGITYPQLIRTLALMLRIYIMIMATSLFVSTTKPILLTKAIEDFLWPLKLLFIPTHILAMIISIALRFIPTLLEEAQRIVKAQASRGIDVKNGKITEKAKSITTLIIPLFVTSFAKAEDLANAMETRGYDPYAKRTRYRRLVWTWRDFLTLFIILGIMAFVIVSLHINFLPSWYKLTYSAF